MFLRLSHIIVVLDRFPACWLVLCVNGVVAECSEQAQHVSKPPQKLQDSVGTSAGRSSFPTSEGLPGATVNGMLANSFPVVLEVPPSSTSSMSKNHNFWGGWTCNPFG